MRVPVSLYRVQASAAFKFSDVVSLVPYLKDLGVGGLYCSPVLKARHRSPHCYDVVDHSLVNPELGGEYGLRRLASALGRRGMFLLLDTVPNHMSASPDNPYWADVLEYGPASSFASMFDIDWDPPTRELRNKVLLPLLGGPLSEEVSAGRVSVVVGGSSRPFGVRVRGLELPLSPSSYPLLASLLRSGAKEGGLAVESLSRLLDPPKSLHRASRAMFESTKLLVRKKLRGDPGLRKFVETALEREQERALGIMLTQNYVLAPEKDSETKINYRRFLNVNELVAVRVEDEAVFERTHEVLVGLLATGRAQGLRVDHVDGLRDPGEYLLRLQWETRRRSNSEPYVVAEKILHQGEVLPPEWPVSGTTGYDSMNQLNLLYVKAENEGKFDRIYRKFSGNTETFEESVYEGKVLCIRTMRSELRRLAELLPGVPGHGAGLHAAEMAIAEVAASFEGYRVYISPRSRGVRRAWRRRIEAALQEAARRGADPSPLILVREALLGRGGQSSTGARGRRNLEFVLRFQQFTAAVAVKGEEDTALYRYNRLTSLNEVGGDPRVFGISLARFHSHNLGRLRAWPHSMVTTSTHDTKRSEDVRARINVLSEIPDAWEAATIRWRSSLNGGRRKGAPSKNDEYLFYQTLLGAWPHAPPGDRGEFVERIVAYMRKATKEERRETGWAESESAYDRGLESFVRNALRRGKGNRFLEDFAVFAKKVDWYGMLNSISQTLVKLTVPGVPDVYQGNELWDYSLVDPDNRRRVDFSLREKTLEEVDKVLRASGPLSASRFALDGVREGRAKLYVTASALRHRSANERLFREGDYAPLAARGPKRDNLIAFSRAQGPSRTLVLAPRFFTELCEVGEFPLGAGPWQGTSLVLPHGSPGRYVEVLTGRELAAERVGESQRIYASDVLAEFPVALLRAL
jgi:malto-oligosyltrehalose synthase